VSECGARERMGVPKLDSNGMSERAGLRERGGEEHSEGLNERVRECASERARE